jgi:hypothetical protein
MNDIEPAEYGRRQRVADAVGLAVKRFLESSEADSLLADLEADAPGWRERLGSKIRSIWDRVRQET